MPRYLRKTVILFKPEVTPGVDPTPTGAANALLVSNLRINPINAQNVDRDIVRAYFGGSEQLVGTRYVEMSFDLEFAGSGTAGTAPAWAPVLRCCGFSELLTAVTVAEYTPESDTLESGTIYWYDDGVLHKAHFARGRVMVKMNIGERPMLSFSFLGVDGGVTAVANATPTLTAWAKPLVITNPNTSDITAGATYNALAGTITGGTIYKSRGLEIDMGNEVNFLALLGGDEIDLTDRQPTFRMTLDLDAASEVTFMADVIANTTRSFSLIHGIAAGHTVGVHCRSVQLINPSKEELNKRRMIGFEGRILPVSGNDELVIFAR